MNEQQPGALARAVCQVMGKVRSVPETGWNAHNRYKYASDADLLAAIQPAMADAGLALIPTGVQIATVVHGESKSGNARFRTDLVLTYHLIHSSGESLQVQVPGCGLDHEDKGPYKAMTGALKYALRHVFLVPTGDDAEVAVREQDQRRGRDDRDDRREPRNERPVDEDGVPHGSAGRVPPAEERRPRLTDDEIARRLASANLTLDEANWFAVTKSGVGLPLAKLDDEQLAKAVAYLTSTDGAQRVTDGIAEVRDAFRNTWFAKWGLLYPTPRKKDGATDEGIAAAEARSETDRKTVLRAWYGVESGKQIGIRALLKGERNLDWLRHVPPNEFERAVIDTLRADSAQAAK